MKTVSLGSLKENSYFKHGNVSFKVEMASVHYEGLILCKIRSQPLALVLIPNHTLVEPLEY